MIRKEEIRPDDLERYRGFLHVRARRWLHARLQGKLDAADMVQETLLQARQTQPRMGAGTPECHSAGRAPKRSSQRAMNWLVSAISGMSTSA